MFKVPLCEAVFVALTDVESKKPMIHFLREKIKTAITIAAHKNGDCKSDVQSKPVAAAGAFGESLVFKFMLVPPTFTPVPKSPTDNHMIFYFLKAATTTNNPSKATAPIMAIVTQFVEVVACACAVVAAGADDGERT